MKTISISADKLPSRHNSSALSSEIAIALDASAENVGVSASFNNKGEALTMHLHLPDDADVGKAMKAVSQHVCIQTDSEQRAAAVSSEPKSIADFSQLISALTARVDALEAKILNDGPGRT